MHSLEREKVLMIIMPKMFHVQLKNFNSSFEFPIHGQVRARLMIRRLEVGQRQDCTPAHLTFECSRCSTNNLSRFE